MRKKKIERTLRFSFIVAIALGGGFPKIMEALELDDRDVCATSWFEVKSISGDFLQVTNIHSENLTLMMTFDDLDPNGLGLPDAGSYEALLVQPNETIERSISTQRKAKVFGWDVSSTEVICSGSI